MVTWQGGVAPTDASRVGQLAGGHGQRLREALRFDLKVLRLTPVRRLLRRRLGDLVTTASAALGALVGLLGPSPAHGSS
jgi:hypothetical protein